MEGVRCSSISPIRLAQHPTRPGRRSPQELGAALPAPIVRSCRAHAGDELQALTTQRFRAGPTRRHCTFCGDRTAASASASVMCALPRPRASRGRRGGLYTLRRSCHRDGRPCRPTGLAIQEDCPAHAPADGLQPLIDLLPRGRGAAGATRAGSCTTCCRGRTQADAAERLRITAAGCEQPGRRRQPAHRCRRSCGPRALPHEAD